MRTIDKRQGICIFVDKSISKLTDVITNEVITLRNHQLEKFGALPSNIRCDNGLKVGSTIHYVSIKDQAGKVMYYIDGDYYFPKEAWCAGAESSTREHKQYFQFVRHDEIVELDERTKNPGFYNHVKFLTSMANVRKEGEIYLGTDNYGYAVGIDDQLSESQIPDAEAALRNYVRMSTGSALFEASLKIEWIKKVGRDGRPKLVCHIVVPEWKGELPVFCNGEAVYIRTGAASIKLRYSDLKSFIYNPDSFISTIK